MILLRPKLPYNQKKNVSLLVTSVMLLGSFFGSITSVSAEIIDKPILNNLAWIYGSLATTTDNVISVNLRDLQTNYYGQDYWYYGKRLPTEPLPYKDFNTVVIPLCSQSGVVDKNSIRLIVLNNGDQLPLKNVDNYISVPANKDIQECNSSFNNYTFVSFDTGILPKNANYWIVNSTYTSLQRLTKYDVPNLRWRASTNGISGIDVITYNSYTDSAYYVGQDIFCSDNLTNRINESLCSSFAGQSYSLDLYVSTLFFNVTNENGIGNSTTTTSTGTIPVINDTECGITSGALILGCIKNAFAWAINIDPSVSNDFIDLMNRLKTKAPIGYVTSVIEVFRFQQGTSTSMILVASDNSLMTYIFNPLRSILAIIIYVFSAVWLFNRVKNIHI